MHHSWLLMGLRSISAMADVSIDNLSDEGLTRLWEGVMEEVAKEYRKVLTHKPKSFTAIK